MTSYAKFRADQKLFRSNKSEVAQALKVTFGLSQSERINLLHQFQETLSLLKKKTGGARGDLTDVRARHYLEEVIVELSHRLNLTEQGKDRYESL